MLSAICNELRAALQARGVPYDVVYGPERMAQSSLARTHIVLERDRTLGDAYLPPTTHTRNPRLDHVRRIGAVLTVYARSGEPGATIADHERLADHIVDQALVALRGIVAARRTLWDVTGARLLSAGESADRALEAWAGVVYEVKLAIDRGVADTPFDGAAAVERTMGGATGARIGTALNITGSPGTSTDLPGATTR
jgi:hypothetical protein